MCTVFEKGRCLKWYTLLALLIFHPDVVICFNKYVVFPVWVVGPFCADPEANVEFGSMEHGQLIVSTFTQLFLMCACAILIQNPGIVWDKKCKLEEKLVSDFLNVTIYIVHLQSSCLIEYLSFSECSTSAPFFKKMLFLLQCAMFFLLIITLHAPWWHCPQLSFPFPAFTLGRTLGI